MSFACLVANVVRSVESKHEDLSTDGARTNSVNLDVA